MKYGLTLFIKDVFSCNETTILKIYDELIKKPACNGLDLAKKGVIS